MEEVELRRMLVLGYIYWILISLASSLVYLDGWHPNTGESKGLSIVH